MNIREGVQFVLRELREWLFPVFCLLCKKEGSWICDACFVDVPADIYLACPYCGIQNKFGTPCCATGPLDSHVAVAIFIPGKIIEQIVYHLKYEYIESLGEDIQKIIYGAFVDHTYLFKTIDMVVPVPLHRKRLATRGFNQATIISKAISLLLGTPIVPALRRIKHTKQQATLSAQQRKENTKNAFTCCKDVQGKYILLVDDVFTSGSTLFSAAQTLRDAGAAGVDGFSFGRARMRVGVSSIKK